MYIERDISENLLRLASGFPAVFLTGPRQSGKSTLLKNLFSNYLYVNLEETDIREYALSDPRGFLNRYKHPVIFDEVQRAPELLSYIQQEIDAVNKPGMYLLSGSQNFLMMRSVSQSLAGRAGLATLLPFSLREMKSANLLPSSTDEWLYAGTYPRRVTAKILPEDFYQSYIPTYVERDIRQETSIHDIGRFQSFLVACARRAGSLVNYADLARDASIDPRTARSWLSILEESYLTFRLLPYHRNIGKRHTKTPKLYFHDSGLLCSLLGIQNAEALFEHELKGHIFENTVVAEFQKMSFNAGVRPRSYYWRSANSREIEVDLILERSQLLELYEIKSSQTARTKHTDGIEDFTNQKLSTPVQKTVIYDGPGAITLRGAEFVNWRALADWE